MSRHRQTRFGRGSRRRLRKIGFWKNWSIGMTIVVILLLFCALVVIPWLSGLSLDGDSKQSIDTSQPALH